MSTLALGDGLCGEVSSEEVEDTLCSLSVHFTVRVLL